MSKGLSIKVYDGNIAVIKFPFTKAELETAMLLEPKVGTVTSPEGDALFTVTSGAETTISAFGATLSDEATIVKVYKKPLEESTLAADYTKANLYISMVAKAIEKVGKIAKGNAPEITIVEEK